MALAQPYRLRRHFDQFVVLDELHGELKREVNWRHKVHGIVLARGPNVGHLLFSYGIDDQIIVAVVDTDDHAFVDGIIGRHKHAAALLQLPDGVGNGMAIVLADQYAIAAFGHATFTHGGVLVEYMAHDAGAASQRHEFTLKANQATCRHAVLQACPASAIGCHVQQFAPAPAQLFHDTTLMVIFNVDGQLFKGLQCLAALFPKQDTWTRYRQLVAFASHLFQQDGQVQLAPATHFKNGVVAGVVDPQRNVRLEFQIQTLAQLPTGDKLAFTTCQWRGIDHEVHGEGGLINMQQGQGIGMARIGQGTANADVVNAIDEHDVTRLSAFYRLMRQS